MEFFMHRKLYYHKFLIFITICILCVQPCLSLKCSQNEPHQEKNSFPQVVLYRGTQLNQTKFENEITYETGEKIQFEMECTHNQPIQWIFNVDPVRTKLTEQSNISRFVRNFNDERTYEYEAVYNIEIIPEPSQIFVLSCQTVNYPCERRIVLAYYDERIDKDVVKLLNKNEENSSLVIDFDNEVLKSTRENSSASSNNTCPLKLTLFFFTEYFRLYHTWNIPNGVRNEYRIESPQTFENLFRFSQTLEEHCVDFLPTPFWNHTICPDCHELSWEAHQFKPLVFYYAVGDYERVLKMYFDLDWELYFSWEQAAPEKLANVSLEGPYYKGQNIPVNCLSSPVMFAVGSIITWSVEGENITQGLAEEMEEFGVNDEGVLLANGTIHTGRFLDKSNTQVINISCLFPIWNSSDWFTSSAIVPLLDSETPKILDKDQNSTEKVILNQNYTFKCAAEGIPLPNLEIIPPQANLNFITLNLTTDNYTELVVTIPIFEAAYEGKYNCVATSPVGVDFKVFKFAIAKEVLLSVKIIIICASVVCLAFILISLGLIFKLRKEKKEFRLLTQQAIKKFMEGFKDTTGIDFDSNSEYQDYEVPLTRWGIGGTMLGSGAFGVVQKGTVQVGEKKLVVAVKTVNSPKDISDFENSLMELTIMSHIGRHEHVVSLVAACTDNIQKRSILIGVEFCANGDLLSYLQKRKDFFHSFVKDGKISVEWAEGSGPYANAMNTADLSTLDLYRWSYQIANGMEFLESKKVLHADLAARNVLITQDKIAKISDFGLSRKLLDSNNYTKKTNSPLPWRWMALESLKFQQFSSQSDVWAFGITLYEIFSLGAEPWPGLSWTIEFVNELDKGRRMARPKHGTENMYHTVMLECWRNEPEERITFANAKQFFETAIQLLSSEKGNNDDCLALF